MIKSFVYSTFFLTLFSLPLRAEPTPKTIFQVTPLGIYLSEKKTQEWVKFESQKDADGPIALEVYILDRVQDVTTGAPIAKENLLDSASSPFSVSPTQVVLYPGESQMVNVKSLITGAIDEEKAFTFLVKQIALPLTDAQIKVNPGEAKVLLTSLINYEGVIYVTPENPTPAVQVTGFKQLLNDKKEAQLELQLLNTGTGKQYVDKGFALTATTAKGAKETVTIKDVENKKHAIYPHSKRLFTIPWPKGLSENPKEITITFNK